MVLALTLYLVRTLLLREGIPERQRELALIRKSVLA